MNRSTIDRVANAVLYEGYILYPYRPSVKNRQRWTFGGLYPEAHCRAQNGSDASGSQTQCLVRGGPQTELEAVVRFLHIVNREAGEVTPQSAGRQPPGNSRHAPELSFCPVETLHIGEQILHTWQEAEEREVVLRPVSVSELMRHPVRQGFTFSGSQSVEPVYGDDGALGVLVRERCALEGLVQLTAVEVADALYRITLHVTNLTPLGDAGAEREKVILRTLVSTHALLGVADGEFVSLLEPPECWRAEAAACQNIGTWPVLVGEEGQRDTMLSSPIILYDYPQVAPESAGDFFDGTEMDEMLTLRVLTLTDDEKHAMTGIDGRAAALLARTESLAREQLASLHGTFRNVRPVPEGGR
jgi:hypothetical protein